MKETSNFIDYYETLEISPNANPGTIERMFRYLARRYHPDNKDTGDRKSFDVVMEAYATLNDPGKRAQYDISHKNNFSERVKLVDEASDTKGIERDVDIQNKLLSVLYLKRRQSGRDLGISNIGLERLLGCPAEHLEFHLWYLKEKGLIGSNEDGMLMITARGVDHANAEQHRKTATKLVTDQSQAS